MWVHSVNTAVWMRVECVKVCVCVHERVFWACLCMYGQQQSITWAEVWNIHPSAQKFKGSPDSFFSLGVTDRQKQTEPQMDGQTDRQVDKKLERQKVRTTGDWWKSYTCNVVCSIFSSGWVDGCWMFRWMDGWMSGWMDERRSVGGFRDY